MNIKYVIKYHNYLLLLEKTKTINYDFDELADLKHDFERTRKLLFYITGDYLYSKRIIYDKYNTRFANKK
jgi:hypothetical protein